MRTCSMAYPKWVVYNWLVVLSLCSAMIACCLAVTTHPLQANAMSALATSQVVSSHTTRIAKIDSIVSATRSQHVAAIVS